MSVAWVAGGVRARALLHHRVGVAGARRVAALGSLDEALRMLGSTPQVRGIHPGQTLAQAQQVIAAAVLWDLRVLAGWLPRGGVRLLRVLAGWFEIANTDELLVTISGGQAGTLFQLGALATSWPQLRKASSPATLRAALAASAWGDPGAESTLALRLGMRARWAARAADVGGPARTWASGGAALVAAGERFAAGRPVPPAVTAFLQRLLGETAVSAGTMEEMAAALPERARWALAGITSPAGLWRAEAAWWARVERDATAMLRASVNDSTPVLGAAAVLAADAWRIRAALEAAARGGGPGGALGAYDAVA